jgi:hypothetical protein
MQKILGAVMKILGAMATYCLATSTYTIRIKVKMKVMAIRKNPLLLLMWCPNLGRDVIFLN